MSIEDEDKDAKDAKKTDADADADARNAASDEEAKAKADADEVEDEEDAANPEAIARRVAALGEDDEIEKLAREEERKLAERRAGKKKGKKGGLEVAASKKLSKIGQRAEPKRSVAVASDADPLIERTTKLSDWAKKNQKTVQMVGALIAVALLGIAGFMWYSNKRETEASVLLTKAIDSQHARVGEPPKEDEEDHTQFYKTHEERREAALKQYREVQAKFGGTGASILARLAEGSMLLDKRDADGAIAAYNDVKGSPLAAADQEVRGRALEGLGFAHELEAFAKRENAQEKDKHLEEALKVFKELESALDIKGFKEMAMYHQARVLMAKGDKDKAKEILLSLKERLNKSEDPVAAGLPQPPSYPYLKEVAMDRLREIDPEAAPKAQGGMPGGGQQLTPAQIRKMMEDMQKKQGGKHP